MEFMTNYWVFLVLGLWFSYKWWNSKRILALIPDLKRKGAVFIDVRSQGEFNVAHSSATINIPLQELNQRLGEIPKTAPVVVCCATGTRSAMAKLVLKKNGFHEVYNLGSWTKFND